MRAVVKTRVFVLMAPDEVARCWAWSNRLFAATRLGLTQPRQTGLSPQSSGSFD